MSPPTASDAALADHAAISSAVARPVTAEPLRQLPPAPAIDVADALHTLSARRARLAAILTAAMMVAYFGFILLVAFDKPMVGTLIAGGRVSVGIVMGAAVIALAPVLTAIYVRWANRHYDAQIAALRDGERT